MYPVANDVPVQEASPVPVVSSSVPKGAVSDATVPWRVCRPFNLVEPLTSNLNPASVNVPPSWRTRFPVVWNIVILVVRPEPLNLRSRPFVVKLFVKVLLE